MEEDKTFRGFVNKDGEPLAITIQLQRSFGPDGNTTSWVTSTPQSASDSELAFIVDKIARASERLELHSRISGMESEISKAAEQIIRSQIAGDTLVREHGDFEKASRDIKTQYTKLRDDVARGKLFCDMLRWEQDKIRARLKEETK